MTHFLLIAFDEQHEVSVAAEAARDAGYPACDVLTPHPVIGIDMFLAPPPEKKPIGWVMVGVGALGAILGYAMQWFSAVIDYPIISGGRPLHSWPAFLLVPYEAAILSAGVLGLLTWMAMCGLPKLYHLLFAAPVVERANQDGYVLVIPFSTELRAWANARFGKTRVHEVQG